MSKDLRGDHCVTLVYFLGCHQCLALSKPSCLLPPFDSILSYPVWRLKGNIIRTVLYIANVLPLQWVQLTKTVHTAWFGLEFVFLCFFRLHNLSVCFCMFCLHWIVESFPLKFWRWCNKLKWVPFWVFLLPPLCCGLAARSISLRTIVNKKQCETRGLFMSLVIHC